MITVNNAVKFSNKKQPNDMELKGLSTDVKPTEVNGNRVGVNSIFLELDTNDFYYFDGEEWQKVVIEGGGSGEYDRDIAEIRNELKKRVYYFDNVASMKSSRDLKGGEYVVTKGYYEKNDGGGASYLIRAKTEEDVDDGGSVHVIGNLVAELIVENYINAKQFGAKGKNTDDTDYLKNALNYIKNNNINILKIPCGTYKVSDTLLEQGIDGLQIVGDGKDYDNNLSTRLLRNADITIFNMSGEISLTSRKMVKQIILRDLYLGDTTNTFTENEAIKFDYAMYCLCENCIFANYNKTLEFKNFYDSKFINCDFTSGGNQQNDIALISINNGKHSSSSEVGWDNTNWIVFDKCRFERYRGSAVKFINHIQPEIYNQEYDPCVGINSNKIYFDKCKFESPFLTSKPVIDIENSSSLYFNSEITVLDGQINMETALKFTKVTGVYGYIKIGYYTTTVNPDVVYEDFNNPLMKLDKCGNFDLSLVIGNITNHYLLNYFIELTANNLTYRTIDINCAHSYKNKRIFNSSTIPLDSGHQGTFDTYGESSYNGIKMLYDNTIADEWRISSQYTNSKHQLRFLYKYGNQTSVNPILINGDADGVSSVQYNTKTVHTKGIELSRETTIEDNTSRSNRYIGYGSSAPTEGFWLKGDIIFNNNPTSGGFAGWICITGGSNSVWKAFGAIE